MAILAALRRTLADGRSDPAPEPAAAALDPALLPTCRVVLFEADAIDLSGCFRLKKSTKNERNRRKLD